jgi:hypothetical protein
MGFVAMQSLRWGDDTIDPGGEVPADEPGRDYAGMLHRGEIREADDTAGASDAELRKELKSARAELDKLRTLTDGPHLAPTDEERELLVSKGLDGGFTLAELDEALSENLRAMHREDLDTLAAEEGVEDPSSYPNIDELAEAIEAKRLEVATDDAGGELPDGVVDSGSGWYEVSGKKIRGRDAAIAEANATTNA